MRDNILKLTREEKLERFGEGEWIDEPDFVEFEHNKIKCQVVRNHLHGSLCGYIKIPEDHILYREFNDNIEREFDVHGGITFNEIVDDEHWMGFDCAHYFDFLPFVEKQKDKAIYEVFNEIFPEIDNGFKQTYKNIEFLKQEIISLADQILEYGK